MEKKNRLSKLIALVLVLCMLLSFCAVLSSCGKDKDEDGNAGEGGNPPSGGQPSASACTHANKQLKNQKPVSCTENGYTGDMYCTDCGTLLAKGEAVTAPGHNYSANGEVVVKAPTCIETGLSHNYCTVCQFLRVSTVPLADHNATFHDAQDGNHFYTCLKCGDNEKKPHSPVDNGVYFEATCISDAYTEYKCADCGGTYRIYSETDKALGHDFSDWVLTEATCVAAGNKTQTCRRAGCEASHSITISISTTCNIGFIGYKNNQAPDCIHDAVAIYACEDCGEETTKNVPATGVHKYDDGVSVGGFIVKTCEYCSGTIKSIDASAQTSANVSASDIDTSEDLEVATKEAAIQFPSDVLGDITTGTELEISADFADEAKKNEAANQITDAAAKEAILNAPVYDFTVKIDDAPYTDNFSSKVAITLPYDNGDNDSDGIVIYYLAEDGSIEAITDVVYNAETKEVTFFVEHFSFYAVAYQETQGMRCKRGDHDYKATDITVQTSCIQFGYTVYECSNPECKKQTLDDIVDRLEHVYGAPVTGTPTCEMGASTTRTCTNPDCHDVIEVGFVGALGHKADRAADCINPSICTVCNKTLDRAKGHEWSDWQITKQPTELATGTRERHCVNCDESKVETIEKLGTIVPLDYENYSDLVNLVGEILNIKGATFKANVVTAKDEYDVTFKMVESSDGYRVAFEAIDSDGNVYEFFYDNGALVYIDTEGTAISTDVNHVVPITMELYKEILEEYYVLLDEYAIMGLEMVKGYITEYKEAYGDTVDQLLAAMGLAYTYDDLNKIIASVESVYAYMSAKLGYTTSAKLDPNMTLPAAGDFRTVLDLFMTKSEANGVTTYTFDQAPIYDTVNSIVKFLEDNSPKSIAEVLFIVYGEELKEIDPSVTSFDALVDYVATVLPGDMTVQDLLDIYINFATETGFMSLDELYTYIDMVIAYAGSMGGMNGGGQSQPGGDINPMPQPMPKPMNDGSGEGPMGAKEFIESCKDMTLDELIVAISEGEVDSMATLYAAIKQLAAETTFGSLNLKGMPIGQIAPMLKSYVEAYNLNFDLTLEYKGDKLVAFYFSQDLSVKMDPEADAVEIDSISISFVRNDNMTLDVPATFATLLKNISTRYDEDGNLIVENLPVGVDFRVSLMGYGEIDVADAVVKDADLTEKFGYDVYVLKDEYWNATERIEDYYLIDGKYYQANDQDLYYYQHEDLIALSDIKASILDRLNEMLENIEDSENGDHYKDHYNVEILAGTETPVYDFYVLGTHVGKCYISGGVWMIATEGKYGYVKGGMANTGVYFTEVMTLDQFVSSLSLANVVDASKTPKYNNVSLFDYYYAKVNGRFYPRGYAYISYGNEGRTFSIPCVTVNGQTQLIDTYEGYWGTSIIDKNAVPVSLPEHDYMSSYTTDVAYFDTNGNIAFRKATHVTLYTVVPTYFIKVDDTNYTEITEYDSGIVPVIDTRNLDTLALPDGKTLYVIGEQERYYYGEQEYTAVFGYIKSESGAYVQTIAFCIGDEVNEVIYRNTSSTTHINVDSLNISGMVSENNGVYTVSKELIDRLNSLCTYPESNFAIMLRGTTVYAGKMYEYYYTVDSYINVPDITDITDMITGDTSNREPFYEFFGYNGDDASYGIEVNDDGSVTLTFAKFLEIKNVSFPSNVQLPADNIVNKNNALSQQTGLDIYSYNGSYTYTYSNSYVYKNGNYYNYSNPENFYLYLADKNEIIGNWRLGSSTHQFTTDRDQEDNGFFIPEGTPFYTTDICFRFANPNYYEEVSFSVYTFFLNGIMYAAVGATTHGESVLEFERALPIADYIKSLVFELNYFDAASPYENRYVNGKLEKIYNNVFYVYEVDENGNKAEDHKYSLSCSYVVRNGERQFINAYSRLANVIKLGSIASVSRENLIGSGTNLVTFYNGTFTIAYFEYESTSTFTANFVKLAGRLYRYDGSWYHHGEYDHGYEYAKMDADSFYSETADRVYYYLVIDNEGNETYYTDVEYVDYYNIIVDGLIDFEDISGIRYYDYFYGYTSEGYQVYELIYYVQPAWEMIPQSDGTVYLHLDGKGYLQIQENGGTYYVPARLIEGVNGADDEIICFIASGSFTSSETVHIDNYYEGYIDVNGNEITISKAFFDFIKNSDTDKNDFNISISLLDKSYENASSKYCYISYYELETFFMIADN